jgi:hypothetical protein
MESLKQYGEGLAVNDLERACLDFQEANEACSEFTDVGEIDQSELEYWHDKLIAFARICDQNVPLGVDDEERDSAWVAVAHETIFHLSKKVPAIGGLHRTQLFSPEYRTVQRGIYHDMKATEA